ncbi:MAG: hypothetical protein RLZZ568_919 [Cyanobacteriota bacterium]|jgi:hypothetical protein
MKTTRYFEEQILVKRPYLQKEWCENVVNNPLKKEIQPDGRIRYWGYIAELNKYLRVVTLDDGETIHNAFPDRNFKPTENQNED